MSTVGAADVGLTVGMEVGDRVVGADVGEVVGLCEGAGVVAHSTITVSSVDPNDPPEAFSTPSTNTLYDPVPYEQQIPSPNVSVILNAGSVVTVM